jgi:hypothetical protein
MMKIIKVLAAVIILLPLLLGCTKWAVEPTPLPWIPTVTPEPVTPSPTVEMPVFNPTDSEASPTPTVQNPMPEPSNTPSPTTIPTHTPNPTSEPTPTFTPEVVQQEITILTPIEDAIVENPVSITGQVAVMPFEGTLVVRIYDAQNQLIAEAPIIAEGEIGKPGTFKATISYGGSPGTGRIEILDYSPKDGSLLASADVKVSLGGFVGGGYFEIPQPQASVPLPLHILARTGIPGQSMEVVLTWVDGTKIVQSNKVLQGKDGRGLILTTLDLDGNATYPNTQQASLEIISTNGLTLAQQQVIILGPNDPNAMVTNVFWVVGEQVQSQLIRVPRTLGIGRASLEALLWGPAGDNIAGFSSAIPSAEEVLSFQGRTAEWGERVTLNSLAIIDGIAHADFSVEMLANPGGALRVSLIRSQIEQTLLQFSTVNGVSITINGRDGLLEP